jgi:hypothetical protein
MSKYPRNPSIHPLKPPIFTSTDAKNRQSSVALAKEEPHFHLKTARQNLPEARFSRRTADWQSAVSPVVNRRGYYLSRTPPVNQERTATLEVFVSGHWSLELFPNRSSSAGGPPPRLSGWSAASRGAFAEKYFFPKTKPNFARLY